MFFHCNVDEVVSLSDFDSPLQIKQLMQRVVDEQQTYECEIKNITEQTLDTQIPVNIDAGNTAISMMFHRLGEPLFIEQKNIIEPIDNIYNPEESIHCGAVVFNSLLPCSIREMTSLFLPSDFNSEEKNQDKALSVQVPSFEDVCFLFENVKNDVKTINDVKNALKIIDSVGMQTVQGKTENALEAITNSLSKDSDLQVALHCVAQANFSLPSTSSFVVAELLKDSNPIETIGTKAFCYIIEKNPHIVGSLQLTMSVNNLNKFELDKKKSSLRNIGSEVDVTIKTEIPVLQDYKLVEKGIKLAKAYPTIIRNSSNNQQDLQFIFHGLVDDFKMEPIQMPLITVAKRLSHPVTVQKTILEELYHNSTSIEYIGIKVLLKIVEEIPLGIEDIEAYVNPEDFRQDKIRSEKCNIINCCRLVSAIDCEEQLASLCSTIEKEMNTEVASTIEDLSSKLKFMYKVNISEKLEWPETFNSCVDNLRSQAILFNLSECLASPVYVRNILILEGLKDNLSTKTAGQKVFSSVMENIAIHCQDTTPFIMNALHYKDSVRKYLALCQHVVKVVSIAKERVINTFALSVNYTLSFINIKSCFFSY